MTEPVDSFQQIANMDLGPDKLALVADAMKLSAARFPEDRESRVDHMRGSLGFICGIKTTNVDVFAEPTDTGNNC